jgi:hypothetical protein
MIYQKINNQSNKFLILDILLFTIIQVKKLLRKYNNIF